MDDKDRGAKLLKMVRAFIKKHHVTGEESVMQSDDPQLEAPEFVAELCEVAGFLED